MESDGTGKMKVQNGDRSDGDEAALSTVSLTYYMRAYRLGHQHRFLFIFQGPSPMRSILL